VLGRGRACAAAVAVGLSAWLLVRFIGSDTAVAGLALLYSRLSVCGWAGLIFVGAVSIGMMVLRLVRLEPTRGLDCALFGAGLGLGIVSAVTLVLGYAGICGPVPLSLMLVAFSIAGAGRLRSAWGDAMERLRRARGAFRWFVWAVIGLFFLMNLVRAYTPPHDYDSLEYHVAAPAAYDRAGRVRFLERNVYASFPQNVEMLHFLGMRLSRSPDEGVLVGQMVGGVTGLLAALALYRMLAGTVGREAGLFAAAFYYTWPGVTLYSGMPFVELPLIFYATLSAWGVLWAVRRRRTRPGPMGWTILSGAAAGLAVGVKYTAALLVFLPLLAWVIVLSALRGTGPAECLRRAVVFCLVALVCLAPWLVRNVIHTGNPTYPLLYSVFDGRHWDAQRDARWRHAHRPHGILTEHPLMALKEQAEDVLFFNERKASVLTLLFAPFCLLVPRRSRGVVAWMAAHWCLSFLLYFLFTQWNSRFLDVGVPLLAGMSGVGAAVVARGRWKAATRALAGALLMVAPSRAINYQAAGGSIALATGAQTVGSFFEGYGPYEDMQFLNENLPSGARVLFLGEARTFYCRRDFVASTVFDLNPLEEMIAGCTTPEDLREAFRRAGVTHIYVDTFEVYRLQTTYRYRYRGKDDPAEREYLGMLDGFDWRLFGEFAEKYLETVRVFRGHVERSFPWQRWEEFRASWEAGHPIAGHAAILYAVR